METIERTALAARLAACAYLEGDFLLRSGQSSREYFDKYQFESDSTLLRNVAARLALLVPPRAEVLAGLELGGVPLATALSLRTGLPQVFVRKAAKAYGTRRVVEGPSVTARRVCVIEDVVTTGGQIIASVQALRSLGAVVSDVLCVVQRDPAARARLLQDGLRLTPLFAADELRPPQKG